ncbi:MAG: hypothetical protein HY903_11265 [Deltaproteobacteria bacterium]|nr:hypothetical protein [Deltaproteobacteria bacterium]
MSAPQQDEVQGLEEAFKKLRTGYEKYFAGVERLEPLKERDHVRTTLRRLMTVRSANTAYRYRLQSLQASLVTYESYWNRITKQIEEGTYRRDLLRLERKLSQTPEDQPPAAPAPPPSPTAAAPAAAPTADLSRYPAALQSLYTAFVAARSETGDTRPLSIETMAATVKKQMAAIKEKYKCERVEFTVAVKDGKAILKAIPR